MATPTENWPKGYLLQLHAQAIEHGMIWVGPISEADADSLKKRFYRIRRRSDKSMAAFIPAEYHLVMAGKWEAGPDGRGRMPIIFDKLPEQMELPGVTPATPDEVEARFHAAAPDAPVVPELNLRPEELKFDVEAFVDGLTANVKSKEQ